MESAIRAYWETEGQRERSTTRKTHTRSPLRLFWETEETVDDRKESYVLNLSPSRLHRLAQRTIVLQPAGTQKGLSRVHYSIDLEEEATSAIVTLIQLGWTTGDITGLYHKRQAQHVHQLTAAINATA